MSRLRTWACWRPSWTRPGGIIHIARRQPTTSAFDLPAGATRLAFNSQYENQAFAFGKRVLALQFHLEAAGATLETWFVGHAAELAATGIPVAGLRAATAEMADRAGSQARTIFSAWLNEMAQA
jgi:GMP synthase (glutamine-hydrolysing)